MFTLRKDQGKDESETRFDKATSKEQFTQTHFQGNRLNALGKNKGNSGRGRRLTKLLWIREILSSIDGTYTELQNTNNNNNNRTGKSVYGSGTIENRKLRGERKKDNNNNKLLRPGDESCLVIEDVDRIFYDELR